MVVGGGGGFVLLLAALRPSTVEYSLGSLYLCFVFCFQGVLTMRVVCCVLILRLRRLCCNKGLLQQPLSCRTAYLRVSSEEQIEGVHLCERCALCASALQNSFGCWCVTAGVLCPRSVSPLSRPQFF